MPATFQSPIRGTTHQAGSPGATFQATPRGRTHQAEAESIEVYATSNSVEIITDELAAITAVEAHYDAKYVNGLEVAPVANESNLATWVDISGGLASKNKVSYDTATLENSIGHWTTNNNVAVSRVQTQYFHGSWSLQASSVAAGDMASRTLAGASAVTNQPVEAGKAYTLHAMVKGSAARTNALFFAWVNSAGVWISNSANSTISSTTNSWTKLTNTAVAPAGAAGFYTFWNVSGTAGASELHYLDNYGYWEGTSTDWVAPTRPARNLVQATEANKPQYLSASKNLLTYNQATIETDTTGWLAGGTTLTRVSTEEHSGGRSLKVESISGPSASSAYTSFVNRSDWVGSTVTGTVWVKGEGASIGKSFRLYIQGYNDTPTWVSEYTGAAVTLTGSWQKVTRTWTNLPAGITNVRLACHHVAPAALDVFYVDTASLHLGSSTTDSPPLSTTSNFPAVLCQGFTGMRAATSTDWDFTSGPTAKLSVYFVARVESPSIQAISNLMNTNPWSSSADGFYIRQYDASGGYLHAAHASGVVSTTHMSVSTGASTALKNVWNVYCIVIDAAAPSIKISVNGTVATSTVTATLPQAPPHNQYALGIGNYQPGVANYEQNVFYAEVIAFSDAHSDTVRQSIERSLGSKYGITVA